MNKKHLEQRLRNEFNCSEDQINHIINNVPKIESAYKEENNSDLTIDNLVAFLESHPGNCKTSWNWFAGLIGEYLHDVSNVKMDQDDQSNPSISDSDWDV